MMPMDMHYCDIFGDCFHCPVAFCPYEKLDDDSFSGWDDREEGEQVENDDESSDSEDGF